MQAQGPQPIHFAVIAGALAAVSLAYKKARDASEKSAFIKAMAVADKTIAGATGWPLGIVTAWAAMESDYGRSGLAKQSKNLFGIKASKSWKDAGRAFIQMPTHEWVNGVKIPAVADFRSYASYLESAQDLVSLIRQFKRYEGANAALQRGDLNGFFQAITASGYSTAPNYGSRIANFYAGIPSALRASPASVA